MYHAIYTTYVTYLTFIFGSEFTGTEFTGTKFTGTEFTGHRKKQVYINSSKELLPCEIAAVIKLFSFASGNYVVTGE